MLINYKKKINKYRVGIYNECLLNLKWYYFFEKIFKIYCYKYKE